MSRNIEDISLSNDTINDYDTDSYNDEVIDKDNKLDLLHETIYRATLEIKNYIEENNLPLLEKLDYVDLINYVEDLIN
jgi:hypothetical protein